MGYGIMAYAVDVQVLSAPSAHTGDPQKFFDWMVEVHRATTCSEAVRTALRELFFCEEHSSSDGAPYGLALQILCARFGGALSNRYWYPVGSGWFNKVGAALDSLGIDFDPHDLAFSGSPISLPEIEDFPAIGHFTRAELEPVARAFDTADLSGIGDEEIAESVTELRDWVRWCVDNDLDLVSFHY
ncbi:MULTISPECIES: DUF7691 family protein [Nocardia]|uniref:DUF7691 family protein n=1 Tax=Nocardia TaxID=1817 RepID=UPI0024544B60|nr:MULTISPECIES: hypothetical protein [Nocardia]